MRQGFIPFQVSESHLAGYHRAARLADGRILVSTSRATDLFRTDDPDAPGTRIGDMIEKRDLPELVTLADGRVLAAGGYAGMGKNTRILASCELFDPASGAWRPAPPMTTRRMNHALVCVGERVLAIGGQHAMVNAGAGNDSVEAWTPGEDQWTPLPKLPRASEHTAAAMLRDGTVLVVDGGAWIWDPSTEAWRESPGAPATTRVALVALRGGGAMVLGGRNEKDRDVPDVSVLDPAGTWAAGPALPESRDGAAAIELADGRIAIAGGRGTQWPTSDTSMLYEWEADYRRASNDFGDRYADLEDGAVLTGGKWMTSWPGRMLSPQLVPLDGTRVFAASLGGCGIWTP